MLRFIQKHFDRYLKKRQPNITKKHGPSGKEREQAEVEKKSGFGRNSSSCQRIGLLVYTSQNEMERERQSLH